MLDTVLKIQAQLQKRTDTAILNEALKAWSDSYQPPRGSEGHYKVYYGTQISAAPVKFLFFINRKKDFPQVYVQYLKNCIRRDLGFKLVPIEIDLRERERSVSNHKLGQNAKVRSSKETEEKQLKKPVKKEAKGGKAKAAPKAKKVGAKAKALAKSNYRETRKGRSHN